MVCQKHVPSHISGSVIGVTEKNNFYQIEVGGKTTFKKNKTLFKAGVYVWWL